METVSLESAGSAAQKYEIYNNSLEAALNRQKLAWQELATATLDSDFIKFFINLGAEMSELITNMGGLQALIPLIVGLIATIKAESILKMFTGIGKWLKSIKELAIDAGGGIKGLTSALFGTATAAGVLQASLAALTIAISIVMVLISKHNEKLREEKQAREDNIKSIQDEITSLEDLKKEYLSLSSNTDQSDSDKERLKEITLQLAEAYGIEQEALNKLNGTYSEQAGVFDEVIYEQQKKLKDAQLTAYEAASSFLNLSQEVSEFNAVPEVGIFSGGLKINEISRKFASQGLQGEALTGSLGVYNKTPEEQLNVLEDFRNELNDIPDKSKKVTKYIDSLNAIIAELTTKIEENQAIIKKYEDAESYVKFYDAAKDDLAAFQQQLADFESSSGQTQIDMIDKTSAALEDMLSKYSNFDGASDYINALASAFLDTKKAIEETDYALNFLIKEESEYKKQQDALKEEKETQEKILKIEQARLALQEAKNQKVRIYREGVGFVYESNLSEVQKAQETLDDLLEDFEYEKKLAEYAKLTEVYNQAMLDDTKNSLGETLREYFRNEENLETFEKSSYEERLKILSGFLSERNRLILESGSTDFETKSTSTETDSEKQAKWDAQKKSVGTYIENYAGYSKKDIPLERRDLARRNANGQYNSKIANLDTFLATGAPKYHTGGIAGVENFNPSTEIVAKLKKGEMVSTQGQTADISRALIEKDVTNNGATISIGNITLPDVTDAESFVDALKNISSMASKDTNKRG